jgi:hypothetical protein
LCFGKLRSINNDAIDPRASSDTPENIGIARSDAIVSGFCD